MGALVRLQAPDGDVIDLAEAKRWLHVDTTADDMKISSIIAAATQRLDGGRGILGRALVHQTWRLELADWPLGELLLPLPPLIGVTAVSYLDSSGTEQTLSPALYRTIRRGENRSAIVRQIGATWPTVATGQTDAVRVTFDCGYVSDSSPENMAVPEPIRLAILTMASSWLDRPGEEDVPEAVASLIAPFRIGYMGEVTYELAAPAAIAAVDILTIQDLEMIS